MITTSLFIILILTGFFHALWALKIWLPIRDEAELARTVVGMKGIDRMPPPLPTWGVVVLVVAGAYWVAVLGGWIVTPLNATLFAAGGWLMTAILLVRGCITYILGHKWPQEPRFKWWNTRVYSPLILYLGLGTAYLMLFGAGSGQ